MKTTVTMTQLGPWLEPLVGSITAHALLIEGEDSQAFSIRTGTGAWVVRVASSIEGYLKDEAIARWLAESTIPVPEVLHTGWLDAHHAVCISRFVPGITLQDADAAVVAAAMPHLTAIWQAFTQVPSGEGYGRFDHRGRAPHTSWREFLLDGLDAAGFSATMNDVATEIRRLAEACPEDHHLVHGDFGSNNVIVDPNQGRVAAIIDWDCAMWGDPLWDIATAFFWRTWLPCMEHSATVWEAELGHLPNFRERVRCYQLRIGLDELRHHTVVGDSEMTAWLEERCRQILAES